MKILNFLTKKPKDAPFSATYTFPAVDFGNGDSVQVIPAMPGGKVGYVEEVVVHNVTETFNEVTTPARVDVGVSGGDADFNVVGDSLGSLAAGASQRDDLTPGVQGRTIVKDQAVGVSCIAPTGGTPAGIASVSVTILWY